MRYWLKMSPLRFLRRDLSRSRRKKAIKLPHFRFFTRFRLRVIIQNFSSYVVLFVGVVFAIIMLLFGMMMSPLLKHYQDDIVDNMIADYQYVLKMPVETENPDAEKYLVKSLLYKTDIRDEEIMVYGIKADSKYYKERLKDGEILISDGLSEKYKLEDGDTIKLEEEYTSDSYEIKVSGVCTYPAALAVFMNEETECINFFSKADTNNGRLLMKQNVKKKEYSFVLFCHYMGGYHCSPCSICN